MKQFTAFAVLWMCLAASTVYAEPAAAIATRPTPTIRTSIANSRFDSVGQYRPAATRRSGRNTTNQKVGAAFAMGFLGFLGGAVVGAKLSPECNCDDPGLQGMMIGAPVGAVVGAIAGWRLAR